MNQERLPRMRIMHVITSLVTGGAEMMLLKLLTATTEKYEQLVVSTMDEGTIGPRISALGVPVHALGWRRNALNPLRAFFVRSLVHRFRPHLIQGWMYHGNLMASFARAGSRGQIPLFWNIQQSLYDITAERPLTAAIIRLGVPLSRHPTAIIYNSQVSAKQHEAFGYHGARRIVIPSGFDCQIFQPNDEARCQVRAEFGLGSDAVLIGLVARYHPMKDHSGFLQAAGLVARAHPKVRFLLIGKGVTKNEPALVKLIAEHELKDRAFLLGERSDIPRLTAAFDIACSASAWGEGFSNAIGEAMATCVPCVVTDIGDSTYAVANMGVSVQPKDPHALAQALCGLIEAGSERRRQLGAAARRRIETEFSLPAIAGRYEDLYQEHLTCFQ